MSKDGQPDLHDKTFAELKMSPGDALVGASAVMRYVSGCMTRERARMATAIRSMDWLDHELRQDARFRRSADRLAEIIEETSIDDDSVVFQWRPSSVRYERGIVPHTKRGA